MNLSASLQNQFFHKAMLLIASGEPEAAYRGQHKMKSRPLGFQDRNYSSLTPGKAPVPKQKAVASPTW